ncbi:MAG: hypothetical protein Q8P97_01435 [bacterium]|nr:hypothetical protein [bacterium]
MPYAIVCRLTGRAVVGEEDGRIFILEHDKNDGKPKDAKGVHLGMFLQPAMSELIQYDPGDYPYEGLQTYLVSAYREETTLTLISISLDPTNRCKVRRLATEAALANLENKETKEWIAVRLKTAYIPAIADIQGVPDERLKSFLQTCAAG